MTAAQQPLLVLVGGFLGAGKTSLILHASAMLQKQGARVAVITNDQDSGLVDSKTVAAHQIDMREVAGGCFCCRFSDLLDAASQLSAFRPDVIFAEPVGSCVDISATILQPLKAYHRDAYRLAPFTVLVDPDLARSVYDGHADTDVTFLFKNQVAEADLLCITKADRCTVLPPLPVPVDFHLSAVSGQAVEQWLSEVMYSRRVVGARTLEIDYQRYAEAEAALGWLNLHANLTLRDARSPAALAGPLLDDIDRRVTKQGITITHLKVFDQTKSGYVRASICANGDEPVPDGDLAASADKRHELVINLRAIGSPDQLRETVCAALVEIDGSVTIDHVNAFRPAPPRPEKRFSRAIVDEH